MREHNKRWLISMMKTSGSQRERVENGRYADTRQPKHLKKLEELPSFEPMKWTRNFYNGKIDVGALVRFLRGQTANDWDQVYSEIIARLPTKLLDYKEMVWWFVANKIEIKDGRPFDLKEQKFLWMGEDTGPIDAIRSLPHQREFYVHPQTNKLVRIEQRAFKRITREK